MSCVLVDVKTKGDPERREKWTARVASSDGLGTPRVERYARPRENKFSFNRKLAILYSYCVIIINGLSKGHVRFSVRLM